MLNELLVSFGVDPSAISKLWAKPTTVGVVSKKNDGNLEPSQGLSAVHFTLDLYKKQLLPGPRFEVMSDTLLGHIDNMLERENVKAHYGASVNSVSLKDFCGRIMVEALTRTLFGNGIFDVEPNIVQYIIDFNQDAWMLVFKYPQPAGSKLNRARDMLLNAFVAYMQGPPEVRSGPAWLIEIVMKQYESLDVRDEDRAALTLMIYWA